MRVGAFLEKQDPAPRDGDGPPSGQERRPGEKCRWAGHQCSSVPAAAPGLLGLGERPKGGGATCPERPAQRRQAFGLQGGKEESGRETGKPGRCSKWRWNPAAGRASEELVAAMTAASGGVESRPGDPSPHPPSPFLVVQTPRKKGSQEPFL